MDSVSVKLDGKGIISSTKVTPIASIEHQLEIHVQDLSIVSNGDFTLDEILQGLKYVVDYRIKGGKMPSLDYSIMKRLLEGLLSNMSGKEGTLLNRRPTAEADLAFSLFLDFLQVAEFRKSVAEKSSTDLCHSLKIHRRCQPRSSPQQKEMAAKVLGLLTSFFPQFSDWKELVVEDEVENVAKVIKDYSSVFESSFIEASDTPLYPPPTLYFDKNVEKLAEMFLTSIDKGLSSAQVEEYRKVYGSNVLPAPPKPSIIGMLWTQISDFMVVILAIVATVEAATGDFKAATLLYAVILLNIFLGFSQEYKASKALEALMSLTVPRASVIRDGKQENVDSSVLVPGDIVVLEEGEAIPADLRLCEVAQLEIVESILTGESVGVVKSIRTIRQKTRKLPLGDCKGNAFMSTVVARGRGKGIVVRTGENTEIGRISKAIVQQPHQITSIQKKLTKLGKILVGICFLLCILVVVIGCSRRGWTQEEFITMLKVGVSLAVSVIPEGLVVVVTITMAIGVKRMAAQNAIVRKLPSVETLGSVTVICSDKTGTLTEGKMGTSELWTSDNSMFVFTESTSLDPTAGLCKKCTRPSLGEALGDLGNAKQVSVQDRSTAVQVTKSYTEAPSHLLISCLIASCCNNSSVSYDEQEKRWVPLGDPTEIAMVVAAQKAGFPRSFWINEQNFGKLGEYAFDSERKLMSVLYKWNNECFILAKGAPEGILTRCTSYLSSFGTGISVIRESFATLPIDETYSQYISKQSSSMAKSGLRVLAFAIRKVSSSQAEAIIASKKASEAESDLVFVGLIGLIDPPKAGVADSVANCQRAGIKVVMITGDHIATATSIAEQIGIVNPAIPAQSRSMRGFEIDLLSEEALAELDPFPVVFARVSPDNKLKIVKALQGKGNSVAMTGDGVNDAPAIKKADVGVAMGIGGTEITKQAADIVLADDNFTSIVSAVKEGRRVFDNIKKFVVYLLSCNSAEIFLFLLAVSFNLELPLTIIQILWANVIADSPPSISLGVEPFELDIMDRPPRSPSEGVLDKSSSLIILAQGLIQTILSFLVYILCQGPDLSTTQSSSINTLILLEQPTNFLYPSHPTLFDQRNLTFFTLTTMQLVQSFLSRSVLKSVFTTGITGNKWVVYAFIISYTLLVLGFYVPGLNAFLELKPLIGIDWAVALVCVVIQLAGVELVKMFFRRVSKSKSYDPVASNALNL